jgi:hypothetical protein
MHGMHLVFLAVPSSFSTRMMLASMRSNRVSLATTRTVVSDGHALLAGVSGKRCVTWREYCAFLYQWPCGDQ